jgi:hypothetical protein
LGISQRDVDSAVTEVGHRLLGTRDKFQKKFDEFLSTSFGKRQSLGFGQSPLLFPLVAVSLKEYLEKETEILEVTNYLWDFSLPELSGVEVDYGKRIEVISDGYYFIHFRGLPFVARMESCCYDYPETSKVTFFFNPEKEEVAKELRDGLADYFFKNNFYKGKKLLFTREVENRAGGLKFLDAEAWRDAEAVLPPNQSQALFENSLGWLRRSGDLKRAGLPTRRGVILSGPPGVGKTVLFKQLCYQAEGITCLFATGEALVASTDIQMLYDLARMLRPTLVFLEDLDFVGGERVSRLPVNRLLGGLLAELDGVKGNEEVVTLASTNFPEVIDKALADRPGRFDLKVELIYPGPEERRRMLALFIGRIRDGISPEVGGGEIAQLVKTTAGLSGAHLCEVVTHAASRCLFDKKPALTLEDLQASLRALKEGGKGKGIGF